MLRVAQIQALALDNLPLAGASLLIVVLPLSLYLLRRTTKTAPFRYARPATTLPILGDTLDAAVYHVDRIYDWLTEQSEALGGPWTLSIPGEPANLILTSPELIEDVLKTQFDKFERGEHDADCMRELFGKGILASDGAAWYFHRKTASNLFSNQMMRDVMYKSVHENAKRLCEVLRTYEARGEAVSFKAVITQFTSDVFGKIGFGVDLNCLQNGVDGKPGNEFVDAFTTAMRVTFLRTQMPTGLWHLKRTLNIGDEKLLKSSSKVIDAFVLRVVNESIARRNGHESKSEADSEVAAPPPPPKDLISLFLNSKIKEDENLKGEAFDSEMHLIRDTVVNFIFAGKDTTSHSVSFFIVMLNRYPRVLAKIQDEMRAKLPALLTGEMVVPSMDDLPQLTYLEAAIRENLRLNPIVPWVGRAAKTDTVLVDGTPVAKGMRIGVFVYATGRSREVWGDDALEFKPERWLDPDTGKLVSVSPFKFAPFIGGPRMCIGMKFAMMELKCALAVLLSKFNFRTQQDPWSITYEAALTMAVKGPLLVTVSSLAAGGASTDPASSA